LPLNYLRARRPEKPPENATSCESQVSIELDAGFDSVIRGNGLMSARQARSSFIDEYIAAHPPEVRTILKMIRAAIRKVIPDAGEMISFD
jgi:hypothetical protein